MTVTPLGPTTTAPSALASGASQSLIDSDFETFLRMLTVQLQNQDPLDPIDNSDYAVQLATFSGVEQQVRTNDLLTSLGGQLGLMGLSELAGWVGRQARADMPVWFEGAPVSLALTPAAGADTTELVVRDASGAVVARQTVLPGTESLDWQGQDADGLTLPDGRYSLTLESFAQDRLIATSAVESYADIVEVRGGAGAATVQFRGGIEIPASRITALRDG